MTRIVKTFFVCCLYTTLVRLGSRPGSRVRNRTGSSTLRGCSPHRHSPPVTRRGLEPRSLGRKPSILSAGRARHDQSPGSESNRLFRVTNAALHQVSFQGNSRFPTYENHNHGGRRRNRTSLPEASGLQPPWGTSPHIPQENGAAPATRSKRRKCEPAKQPPHRAPHPGASVTQRARSEPQHDGPQSRRERAAAGVVGRSVTQRARSELRHDGPTPRGARAPLSKYSGSRTSRTPCLAARTP